MYSDMAKDEEGGRGDERCVRVWQANSMRREKEKRGEVRVKVVFRSFATKLG